MPTDPTLTDEDLATLDKQLERGEFGGMAGTLRQVIAALRASREEVERLRELDDARHDLANARIDAAQYASDFWNTDRVLKTCREDLRIANEATLVLVERAAEAEADVERLRRQNKESSDRWTQRTAKMESELARYRHDRERAVEWMQGRPSADGFGYSENDRNAVAAALAEVERLKSEVAGYRTVAHRGPM